jgi:hypothetical protein
VGNKNIVTVKQKHDCKKETKLSRKEQTKSKAVKYGEQKNIEIVEQDMKIKGTKAITNEQMKS